MLRAGLILVVLAPAACDLRQRPAANRWADERLWPVLDAQERRDADALCGLLSGSDAAVREAAALAFASVQDAASMPCLLRSMGDSAASVRATAAFALGFIADSAAVGALADLAMEERDPQVQHALLHASFIAMQRNGLLHDANAILYYMDREQGHESARAADALRRLPDSVIHNAAFEIHERMGTQETDARQFLILAMRKMGDRAMRPTLGRIAWESPRTNERVCALRAYGALYKDPEEVDVLLGNTLGPAEEQAALEALMAFPSLDAKRLGWYARQAGDTLLRIGLLGLVMKHGDGPVVDSARQALRAVHTANPYHRAAVIKALSYDWEDGYHAELMSAMTDGSPSVVRLAAFHGLVAMNRAIMMRSRYASPKDQWRQLGNVLRAAIQTKDPGLIAAVAELLQEEEAEAIRILLPNELEKAALAPLRPLTDLEAAQLIALAAAKRDGLAGSPQRSPAFNHPIDRGRLLALKQGQRYRIVTSQGDILIATDVDGCPGSSLAFDSLVTSGFYDGKAFHRMVPGFVIQGGCPRGDGYGGMPWTLRTEIGRAPFTAGAVGLASAGRDTESCQFFITQAAAPHLDGRYTRFGEVVEGMDVVWRIRVGDRIIRAIRQD